HTSSCLDVSLADFPSSIINGLIPAQVPMMSSLSNPDSGKQFCVILSKEVIASYSEVGVSIIPSLGISFFHTTVSYIRFISDNIQAIDTVIGINSDEKIICIYLISNNCFVVVK